MKQVHRNNTLSSVHSHQYGLISAHISTHVSTHMHTLISTHMHTLTSTHMYTESRSERRLIQNGLTTAGEKNPIPPPAPPLP
jgi:hypothetical protein